MRALLEAITSKDFSQAGILAEELVSFIMEKKLLEMKKMVGSVMVSEQEVSGGKTDLEKKTTAAAPGKTDLETRDQTVDRMIERNTKKLHDMKDRGQLPPNHPITTKLEEDQEELDEAARFKIVKARIRGGKVQRRRKVATVKGLTFRGGRLIRMSPAERRRRKLGQRRGKIKRKSKINRTLMKRKRSMLRRKAMGIR